MDNFKKMFLDSSHDLRSTVVSLKSLIAILEMQDYEISKEDLKNFTEILKQKSEHWFDVFDRLSIEAKNNHP